MDPTKAGALTLLSFILFLIFAQTDAARATAISLKPRTPVPEPVAPGLRGGRAMSNAAFEGRVFEPRYVLGWLLFTMSAGIVNAGAVLASNTVVTHITGNVTALALDAKLGITLLVVVALFVVGAMLASLLAETLSSRPAVGFALPITFAVALLLTTAIAGKSGLFGTFGAAHEITNLTFVMLELLALAMGMVNSAVAGATNNQVRTTHLSGPATDLAGNVVRGLLGTGKGKRVELRWGALRIAMLCSFACGGLIAAKIGNALRYDVFVVGAGTLVLALGLCTASLGERRASSALEAAER